MALVAARVTVADEPTALLAAGLAGRQVVLRNAGDNPVFLGGSDVATTTGFELPNGESIKLALSSDAALFGIVASGTEPVHIIGV